MDCYLGLDIGGSSIKSGVVNGGGDVLASLTRPQVLAGGRQAGLNALFRTAEETVAAAGLDWDGLDGIGVATPGTIDTSAGVVLLPVNMPGWEDLPLARLVEERFSRPVVLQNDANAAAWGEYWIGAAWGVSSLLMWTLGTGIGSGIVLHGQIWEGAHGHAGECGHMTLQLNGGPGSEHHPDGSLELLAGSKALVRNVKAAIDSGRQSMLTETDELTPLEIARAAEAGDELAWEVILAAARCLGVATVSVMNVLDPEMVLVGGAMTFGGKASAVGRRFLERVREEVQRRAFQIPAERTIVDFAELGPAAGYIGAAGYAKLKLREG